MLITPEVVPLPATQPKTATLLEILRFLSLVSKALARLAKHTHLQTLLVTFRNKLQHRSYWTNILLLAFYLLILFLIN